MKGRGRRRSSPVTSARVPRAREGAGIGSDPPETGLLLLLSRTRLDARQERLALERMNAGVSWKRLLRVAQQQRVSPLVYHQLAKLGATSALPPGVLAGFRTSHHRTAYRNLHLFKETVRIAEAFGRASLPVILLKGMFLAHFVYPARALRPMSDIDLLVPGDRVSQACDILEGMGFWGDLGTGPLTERLLGAEWNRQRVRTFHKQAAGETLAVELHWHIHSETSRRKFDVDELWKRSREYRLGHVPVRVLSPPDLLIHLAWHLHKHLWLGNATLLWLCDIAEVLGAFPDALEGKALAADPLTGRYRDLLQEVLLLSSRFLGRPSLEELRVMIGRAWNPAIERKVEARRFEDLFPFPQVPRPDAERILLSHLRSLQGKRPMEAIVMLREMLLPSRRFMRRRYGLREGDPRIYACYAFRVGKALGRAAKGMHLHLRRRLRSRLGSAPSR
jgi:hypothetical protein